MADSAGLDAAVRRGFAAERATAARRREVEQIAQTIARRVTGGI